MKKILIIFGVLALIFMVGYYGMMDYLEMKADAEDYVFTAYTYEYHYDERGYIPRTEIQMTRNELSGFMNLYDHKTRALDGGHYVVELKIARNERWRVEISNPEDIKWLAKNMWIEN